MKSRARHSATPEEIAEFVDAAGAGFRQALKSATYGGADPAPEPSPVLAYMSGRGTLFERMNGDLLPTSPIPGALLSLSDAAAQFGPLVELVAIGSCEATRRPEDVPWSPARPDPLGMFGFAGKFVECARRTKEGPWCEWRANTSRLSLAVLIGMAQMHTEQVHDG